jgi:uncharacterized protein YdeI (YjbR/CyaY-like superfamily)
MKNAGSFDPRVDAYINKAAAFAQPVLTHVRELVHKTLPDIQEDIKWSMPFFLYQGQIFGYLAAFKAHCSFDLVGAAIREVLKKDGFEGDNSMGSLGKITSFKDLPSDKVLTGYIRQAATFIENGSKTMSRTRKSARPAPELPSEFAAALKKSKTATKVWSNFSPSAQREYTDWITEAKRDETKQKRIAQAIEWIAEGKQRNWKYQNC